MKRVITGHDADGRSVIVASGEPPCSVTFEDGGSMQYCWETRSAPTLLRGQADPTLAMSTFMPVPGGTTFVVTQLPGYSESNTHSTLSVDYIVIISGELWLVLDSGDEVLLSPGDTVIQNATQHAWQNRNPEPCTLAAIMLGAT